MDAEPNHRSVDPLPLSPSGYSEMEPEDVQAFRSELIELVRRALLESGRMSETRKCIKAVSARLCGVRRPAEPHSDFDTHRRK